MSVSDTLLTAELKNANIVDANIIALQAGKLSTSWQQAIKAQRGINVITWKLSIGDTSSPSFQAAYACLQGFVGNYTGGAISPDAQNPNTTIVVNNTGTIVNSAKIPFTNTTNVELLNYNLSYKSIYGNNPDVSFWLNDTTQDTSTPPEITYATPGDITSDITQIVWDYPLPVSGYIQISGSPDDV